MAVFEDRILRLPADVVAAVWMGTGFGALAVSRQADTKLYRLTLIDGTESFTLWEGEAGVSPMLFHIEGETALCFFPGEALLSISRPEATVTCTKLSPDGKLRMPVMLGVGRDGLPALINQPHGIDIVRLYVSKARYGFYGTMTICPERDCTSDTLWTLACTLIAEAINAQEEAEMIGIRDFLDSKMGRHFADEVIDAMRSGKTSTKAALDATIDTWMRRGINAQPVFHVPAHRHVRV